MTPIKENLKTAQAQIQKACIRNKQSVRNADDVKLIAVSKKQPIERIHEMLKTGQRIYGENRVQEATARWTDLRPNYPDLELHLIGPLQSNKASEVVALFDVIQTIDRPKIVKALTVEMKKQNKNIPCFVQVNTGQEDQKAGIAPNDLPEFLALCKEEGLNIVGLMCIPPINEPPALHFAFLKKLADEQKLVEISMGMSSDYDCAIPLGATYIRLGTALFGARDYD